MTSNLPANTNRHGLTAFHLTLNPPDPRFAHLGREFLDSLHREASRRFGGSCRGLCTDGGVTAELWREFAGAGQATGPLGMASKKNERLWSAPATVVEEMVKPQFSAAPTKN